MRPRTWLAVVVVAALAFTLLVSVMSIVRFAYRSPALHVATETAAALISLLAAQLVYGRFRRSLDRRDLLLTASLALFAGSNLCFAAIPAIATVEPGPFATWARALGGALAAALLAAAAYMPERRMRRPVPEARRALGACALALAAIGVLTGVAGDLLPRAIEPGLSPEAASRPRIVGEPFVLLLQLVVMALFALAAVGFARRAERGGDLLVLWFAIGATLAAFARLNYFLFPSLFSQYFYAGDVLRLGFFLCLLIGGACELRLAQRELERTVLLEERRRLARDIHDGLAQDLAFIAQQGAVLAEHPQSREAATQIVTAARRALDESRAVIAALVRPIDEPLTDALGRIAEEAAGRWGAEVVTNGAASVDVSAPTREALMRIVGEAVANAARHGRASCIRLELEERPELCLSIVDDGVGFDPARLSEGRGRHGMVSMRDRAEQIGGELHVDSRPGAGTTIRVVLP